MERWFDGIGGRGPMVLLVEECRRMVRWSQHQDLMEERIIRDKMGGRKGEC